jgi:hypothetical protein
VLTNQVSVVSASCGHLLRNSSVGHTTKGRPVTAGRPLVLPGASERRGHAAGRCGATDADQDARTAHTSVWRAPPARLYEIV